MSGAIKEWWVEIMGIKLRVSYGTRVIRKKDVEAFWRAMVVQKPDLAEEEAEHLAKFIVLGEQPWR
mgnify:FL=1